MQNVEKIEMQEIPWDFFPFMELECHHCKKQGMDADFMVQLVKFRRWTNIVMPLSSAYRCPEHNAAVSLSGLDGPHTTGQAVDIKVFGAKAHHLLGLILNYHVLTPAGPNLGERYFTGVGVNQRGRLRDRFIHIDNLETAPGRPRPWVWTY